MCVATIVSRWFVTLTLVMNPLAYVRANVGSAASATASSLPSGSVSLAASRSSINAKLFSAGTSLLSSAVAVKTTVLPRRETTSIEYRSELIRADSSVAWPVSRVARAVTGGGE